MTKNNIFLYYKNSDSFIRILNKPDYLHIADSFILKLDIVKYKIGIQAIVYSIFSITFKTKLHLKII